MIKACEDTVREHFLPEFLQFYDAGEEFHFEEKKDQGQGKAFFRSSSPVLKVKAKDQAPMIWSLSNKKCAEGAFITFERDGCKLHIIEMKMKMSHSRWVKALLQLKGMYLTSLAVARLVGISDFMEVICHVAYSEDAMSADKVADPILIKGFVGTENPIGGNNEWTSEKVSLPFGAIAKLNKGVRTNNGGQDVDFGTI